MKSSCAFDDVSKVPKTNISQVNCKQINTLYCFSKLVLTVLPYIFISSSIKCNSINFDLSFSFRQLHNFLGVIHIWCLLWGRLRQNWDVIGLMGVGRGEGVSDFLDGESLFFLLKKIGFELKINILLTRYLLFDSDVRQWSHPLMIPMHCLWAKSNTKTRGQFECDLTWFCFCFRSYGCFIVCLRFEVVQIEQVDCKMSTKNVNNYIWKTFCHIFGQLLRQEYEATKKQIMRLQLNQKKSKESQTRLMSWYRKRKPTGRKDLIT